MTHTDPMKTCIELCWACRTTCHETLINHCLPMGGKHVEQDHVKGMLDCIQICQTAADFMSRESELHFDVCRACAHVCNACADSCNEMDSPEMKECAEICRKCADSCLIMTQMKQAA